MATKTYWLSSIVYIFLLIFDFSTSFFDIDELKTVHYGLDIASEPVVITEEVPVGAIELMSKYGQQYRCSFPDHNLQDKEKEEQEKVAMETGILQLLKPLEKGECLYKTKDWWSYEFCYGKYIRQYHAEDGVIKGEIIYLGYYESDYDWDNKTKKDERLKSKSSFFRYHSQTYNNGSKCDLTQTHRRSEVRFLCEEGTEDYIVRIDEPQTCMYIITINTARLCSHPYLKPLAPKKPVSITCNPLLSTQQYKEYLLDIEVEQNRKKAEEQTKLEEEQRIKKEKLEKTKAQALGNEENVPEDVLADLDSDGVSSPAERHLKNTLFKEVKILQDRIVGQENNLNMKIEKNKISKQAGETSEDKSTDDSKTIRKSTSDEASKEDKQTKQPTDKREEKKVSQKEDIDNDDESEIYKEFEKELKHIKTLYKNKHEKFVSMKEKVMSSIESQFDQIVSEAEDTLGEKIDKKLAFQQLSDTLKKLVQKLQNTEKEIDNVDKMMDEYTTVGDITIGTRKVSETPTKGDSADLSSQSQGGVKAPPTEDLDAEDRIKVRVRRIKSGGIYDDDEDIPDKTRKQLEDSVKEGLEKAGLDTGAAGGKIQVKIITSGYYSSDDESIHILSDSDSAQFQNLIVAVLGGTNEAVKEEDRQRKLEDNYSKVWRSKTPQTKSKQETHKSDEE